MEYAYKIPTYDYCTVHKFFVNLQHEYIYNNVQ